MHQHAQQSDAAPKSIVWIEFVGGPCDGEMTPACPSLVKGEPLKLRRKTRYVAIEGDRKVHREKIHVYIARRKWRGERTLTVYHRGGLRIVG